MRRVYFAIITLFYDDENKSPDIISESSLIEFNYLCALSGKFFVFFNSNLKFKTNKQQQQKK